MSDPAVATADEVTRNNAATTLVAAAAQVLASHPEYAKREAISVAIIHPAPQALAAVGGVSKM